MEMQEREYEEEQQCYSTMACYDPAEQEEIESQVMDKLCLMKQTEQPLLTTITCGDHQIMIPLVPELKNTVIHLDVYLSHQRRVDPTLTRPRLQQQLRLTGKHQIMIKGSLVDVFGPVRAHINICLLYTSPSPRDRG